LGFLTFLAHFIVITINAEKTEKAGRYADDEDIEQDYDEDSGKFADIDATVATQAEQELAFAERTSSQDSEDTIQAANGSQMDSSQDYDSSPQEDKAADNYYESMDDSTSDSSSSYGDIGLDLESLEDYSVEDILREYGIDDD